MASRKLEDLYEPLRVVLEESLKEADEKGLDVVVTCTQRSSEEQEALYAQGREDLLVVNKKREALGMVRLKAAGNRRKITWTLKSYHTCEPKSMAFDFAIGSKSKIYWDLKADVNDNEIPDYEEFAKICKSKNPNIEWGGDFKKSKDCPHIQWKNGMAVNQNEVVEVVVEEKEKKEKKEKKEYEKPPQGGFTKCLKRMKGSILKSFRRS